MATTYTENYSLGKQTDHSDKLNMAVITDNMDKIDFLLHEVNERIDELKNTVDSLLAQITVLTGRVAELEEKLKGEEL